MYKIKMEKSNDIGIISRLPNLLYKMNTAEIPREERGGGGKKSSGERKF